MFRNDVPITPELVAQHGLTPDEYQRFRGLIGRDPTLTELGIVSAMWNEHCSYKSSRKHLKGLPTTGPCVIQGPGENAGVIDIGDGLACVFKMESHNHPSYIEPYQGAATGVGGIMRDVFTMGARPIANAQRAALRRSRASQARGILVSGVVAGIGGYGNCIGHSHRGRARPISTAAYNGNILVNAMTVGIAPHRQDLLRSRRRASAIRWSMSAPRPAATASTAPPCPRPSSTRTARAKRPTVQVGDPFVGEAAARGLPEADGDRRRSMAIQDMGAAGLTCVVRSKWRAKGGLGLEMDTRQGADARRPA